MSHLQYITDITALSDQLCRNLLGNKKFAVAIRLKSGPSQSDVGFVIDTLITRLAMLSFPHFYFPETDANFTPGESIAGIRLPWSVTSSPNCPRQADVEDGNDYCAVIGWLNPSDAKDNQPSCDVLSMQVVADDDACAENLFDAEGRLQEKTIYDQLPMAIAIPMPGIWLEMGAVGGVKAGQKGGMVNYWGEHPLTKSSEVEEPRAVTETIGRVSAASPNSALIHPHPGGLFQSAFGDETLSEAHDAEVQVVGLAPTIDDPEDDLHKAINRESVIRAIARAALPSFMAPDLYMFFCRLEGMDQNKRARIATVLARMVDAGELLRLKEGAGRKPHVYSGVIMTHGVVLQTIKELTNKHRFSMTDVFVAMYGDSVQPLHAQRQNLHGIFEAFTKGGQLENIGGFYSMRPSDSVYN